MTDLWPRAKREDEREQRKPERAAEYADKRSRGEKCELARWREGGEGDDGERGGGGGGERVRERRGIRKWSSQTVRLSGRYVWNGVSLYRAQCVCVNSLSCLSLEELPLPIPIGTTHPLPPIMHSPNTQTPPSTASLETHSLN